MTKQEYFNCIQADPWRVVYSMYLERFHQTRTNQRVMNQFEFMMAVKEWHSADILLTSACLYYDNKFEIQSRLYDKHGKLIKFL
jgi:hypothetical protein